MKHARIVCWASGVAPTLVLMRGCYSRRVRDECELRPLADLKSTSKLDVIPRMNHDDP
jgi:hypothetical protein